MKHPFRNLQSAKNRPIRSSIKEALDLLPSGVCFFFSTGTLALCNQTMLRLVHTMTGRDIQLIDDLKTALTAPPLPAVRRTEADCHSFLFPDGKVWSFSETPITDENGVQYLQFVAKDVTELHTLSDELAQRNEEVRELIERFQRIAKNVLDITRQEEILAAKMRIHGKMGSCIVGTQHYCAQDCPAGGKEALLRIWEETLSGLEDEIGQEDDEDAAAEFIRVAKNCGVEVLITGSLPEDRDICYLLVTAMRECLTNLITHAQGDRLSVDIRNFARWVTAVITNNGKAPDGEIAEGGGLTSLRRRIEGAGGRMRVESLPAFALTVTLPNQMTEQEMDIYDKCIDRG